MIDLVVDLLWGFVEFLCWRSRKKEPEAISEDGLNRL